MISRTRFILLTLALPTPLMAQEVKETIYDLTTIAGRQSTIGEWYGLYTSCMPVDWVEMIIVDPPKHGKAEIKATNASANYPTTNPRAACNGKPAPAKAIAYTPDEDYSGADSIVVDRVISSGDSSRARLNITVRQLPKEKN